MYEKGERRPNEAPKGVVWQVPARPCVDEWTLTLGVLSPGDLQELLDVGDLLGLSFQRFRQAVCRSAERQRIGDW